MSHPTTHNTYMPGYAAPQVRHHEWRTAENSCQFLLPTLTSLATNTPTLKLLDVGAGSGTISASLARYIPHGHITATDLSDEILQRAADYAKGKGVSNISFREANVYHLPFEDESFDVVHASMVLNHLDDPVAAYREMLRVCKPGGVVANRESDGRMYSYYPELPGIRKFLDLMVSSLKASGGDVTAGPKLVSWAMKAGARREQITASMGTWTYSTPEERQMWGGTMLERIKHGGMRTMALQHNLATESDMDEMARDWEAWIAAEDGVLGLMHGEILIRK
ncbi:hypothetical protein BAUCODRAFT_80451 [Baudoinia panamericana UAMH 10762]|uniref:Methyltransferase type 11 domain-containing protein n=1 Tax=Baudoinia panamericana (strain UAMH 10762) TaxID=717646 RepID=M2MWU3_BAUPA|nr:uncharacterized protein BAUCODRAFT_80451 [Baudoinia panamericana UAMH 10762]EMC91084.1 hypothetical protein BAUCODRAFT_80451 [Baudoinia panamericana UAMH 10762]